MVEVISRNTVSESWDFVGRKENPSTGDHVIDAWLKGKIDGLKSAQRAVLQSLVKNVDQCALIAHTVIEQLTKLNFFESTAFLKINSWNSFKVLITIKEENFLAPKFLEV